MPSVFICRFARLRAFCAGLVLTLAPLATSPAQTLRDIRLGEHSDHTRAVIEMDAALGYQVFFLSGPPRMVVDVQGLQAPAGFAPSTPLQGVVRDVRIGQFANDVTRIVFDLNQSSGLLSGFFLNPQGGAGHRLVLNVSPTIAVADHSIVLEAAGSGSSSGGTSGGSASTPTTSQTPITAQVGRQTIVLPLERPASISNRARFVIVLDPGHGGRDPGAVSANGLEEADLVLDMAFEISNVLRASGNYEVLLTRGTDELIPLQQRAALARGRQADFFLSIHANANPDPGFRGFMIFTLSETASDSYAAQVAEEENAAAELGAIATVGDEAVEEILTDMLRLTTQNLSIDFATRLIQSLRGEVHLPTTPQRRAGFAVLKSVGMPSALLEIGHLSNRREAASLQRQSHRRKIAIAVREALDAHFANY